MQIIIIKKKKIKSRVHTVLKKGPAYFLCFLKSIMTTIYTIQKN
jgi:hypothetical protein